MMKAYVSCFLEYKHDFRFSRCTELIRLQAEYDGAITSGDSKLFLVLQEMADTNLGANCRIN